jgi:hypothetical protein
MGGRKATPHGFFVFLESTGHGAEFHGLFSFMHETTKLRL